ALRPDQPGQLCYAATMARVGTMNRRKFLFAGSAALLAACGKRAGKIRLALNWKPDPQFGGFYAAPYQAHGLDVEVLPGGAGTPTIQMVGAGSAEFGVVSADELVVARSQGNDVVALFAVFQNNPQGIMVHASRKLTSLADLLKSGATLALQRGLPYATVLVTSGDSLRQNPDRAKAMVAAVREGWRAYLDDPKPTNQRMNQLNPSMAPEVFAEVAEAQKPLIETDETRRNGLGSMSGERWQTLIAELQELGDIRGAPAAGDCYRNL